MPDDKQRNPEDDEQRNSEEDEQRAYYDDGPRSTGVGTNNGGSASAPVDTPLYWNSRSDYVGRAAQARYNGRIVIEHADEDKLETLALHSENGDILRDAFRHAIRFSSEYHTYLSELQMVARMSLPRLRLEISASFPRSIPDATLTELAGASTRQIYLVNWEYVVQKALDEGAWAISFAVEEGKAGCTFEYALVLRDTDPKMKEILGRYKQVQEERARIDATRDAWVKQDAQPLLDEMHAQLQSSTLPEVDRAELLKMFDQLRQDTYFRNIVQTADVEQSIDLKGSWIREMASEGRLGMKLSRFYIHSVQEVAHFAKKPRNVGKPPKNSQ